MSKADGKGTTPSKGKPVTRDNVYRTATGILAVTLISLIGWTAQRDIARVDASLLDIQRAQDEMRGIIATQAETDARLTTLMSGMRSDVDRLEDHVLDGGGRR